MHCSPNLVELVSDHDHYGQAYDRGRDHLPLFEPNLFILHPPSQQSEPGAEPDAGSDEFPLAQIEEAPKPH